MQIVELNLCQTIEKINDFISQKYNFSNAESKYKKKMEPETNYRLSNMQNHNRVAIESSHNGRDTSRSFYRDTKDINNELLSTGNTVKKNCLKSPDQKQRFFAYQ